MRARDLRYLRKEAKKQLTEKNEQLYQEVKTEDIDDYLQIKKWQWWHLIPIVSLIIIGIGFSFLVGYLTKDSIKAPDWQGTTWFALAYSSTAFIIWLILGWIKNRNAMYFYQDKRYRYRLTYQVGEARIRKIRKIIFISLVPLVIFTIVLLCVL